ncbi:hypothetical protein Tco_0449977 [Tanacetum coccineum]
MEAAKTLSKVASQRSKSVDKGKRYKRRKESKGKDISTGFKDVSTGFEEVNTGGLGVSTGSGPVSSARGQREGKAPMIVEETQAPKRTKEQIQQEEASLAEAIRLQTLEEEETAKQKYGTNRPEDAYDRLATPEQTATGKEYSNPLIADDLLKIICQCCCLSVAEMIEAHNEDIQRNLKFTSEDQVRGGLLGIIVNRLKSGSYRVKSGRHIKSSSIVKMNLDSVDKNDPKDVQFQDEDIMYDIASSVEIQKVYEFKRFLDRLNDDDVIVIPHEDAQATLGDTNDPFTSI